MKLTYSGKVTTQLLSVVLCALISIMLGCMIFAPYFTITEPYHFILNKNPMPDHYTLADVMWFETITITTYFTETLKLNFHINDYVTSMVLGFVFCLAAVPTSIWFARNEFKRYPSLTSGIFMNLTGILAGLFTVIAYLDNAMLNYGVEKFMYIRWVILAMGAAILVLSLIRFVIWLIVAIKVASDRKKRLALL